MAPNQSLNVSLPTDLADLVKSKVTSGEYASESDLICDGLSTLLDRDAQFDHLLKTEVIKSIDEYNSDPESVISSAQVIEALDERLKHRLLKR